MQSTTNSRVANFIAMILMLTGNSRLLAWPPPTHCLHSLGTLPPLQRAVRQCVEHVQAMVTGLPGGLLAWVVPTDCLRSLENQPPFHRAVRQYVGSPEAICPLYDKDRQQPDGNYACQSTCCYELTICVRSIDKWILLYYARAKSSLSSKRVKTSPEFKWTMINAGLMACASKIGSAIYKALPPGWRGFCMYRSFTGEALRLLKENPYSSA